uniref:Uncharacterized protein n=1 Tax=Eutreptiella gymnastica TaxID=73025 RepID=A0A7S4FL21_9EUGL
MQALPPGAGPSGGPAQGKDRTPEVHSQGNDTCSGVPSRQSAYRTPTVGSPRGCGETVARSRVLLKGGSRFFAETSVRMKQVGNPTLQRWTEQGMYPPPS